MSSNEAKAQWRYVAGIGAGNGGPAYYIAKKLEEILPDGEVRVLQTGLVTEPMSAEQLAHLYKQIGVVLGFREGVN